MRVLTKALFVVSDALAWLLLAIALLVASLYPIAGPAAARMYRHELPWWSVAAICAACLLVALGAFAITRRRAAGLLPIVLAAALGAMSHGVLAATLAALVAVALFGTPFGLVALQARRQVFGRAAP